MNCHLFSRGYRWSSARAHSAAKDDRLVTVTPLLEREPNWATFIGGKEDQEASTQIETHSRTGRPLGDTSFAEQLEAALGRTLAPQKRGRKPKHPQHEKRQRKK